LAYEEDIITTNVSLIIILFLLFYFIYLFIILFIYFLVIFYFEKVTLLFLFSYNAYTTRAARDYIKFLVGIPKF